MSFLSNLFGSSESAELKNANKTLIKRNQDLEKRVETLEEKAEDDRHAAYRSAYLERRSLSEDREDYQRDSDRAESQSKSRIEDAIESATRKVTKEAQATVDKKEAELSGVRSEMRELTLALEEQQASSDLEISEIVLAFKEEHIEDISKLEVQVAKLEGQVAAAKEVSASKDQVIKVLNELLEKSDTKSLALIKALTEIAPKFDLSKLNFEISVPSQKRDEKKN